MPLVRLITVIAGAATTLLLRAFALAGPSVAKAQTRRLGALRERHSGAASDLALAAQMRRITGKRDSNMDTAMMRFLPRPAVLKKRLAMTGKTWTVGQYGLATFGIMVVVALLLVIRGAPIAISVLIAVFIGGGLPHFVVTYFIKRRVNKFTVKFPDAIELLVRGLRSGLPISETMGVVGAEV